MWVQFFTCLIWSVDSERWVQNEWFCTILHGVGFLVQAGIILYDSSQFSEYFKTNYMRSKEYYVERARVWQDFKVRSNAKIESSYSQLFLAKKCRVSLMYHWTDHATRIKKKQRDDVERIFASAWSSREVDKDWGREWGRSEICRTFFWLILMGPM